jgi:Fe-S cluster biogenesis protein NfuA
VSSTSDDDKGLREQFQRVGTLLGEVEQRADPAVLAAVQEIVQSLLDFHGAGLARLVERVGPQGVAGLTGDELVSSLLLLHGLHPQNLETRVGAALESIRPQLRKQGGDVELVGIQDGVVHLHMHAGGHGCGSSVQTLRETIEEAVYSRAPDVASLVIEGDTPPPTETFIPEQLLQLRPRNGDRPTEEARCSN